MTLSIISAILLCIGIPGLIFSMIMTATEDLRSDSESKSLEVVRRPVISNYSDDDVINIYGDINRDNVES
jgi:hypothetical protein